VGDTGRVCEQSVFFGRSSRFIFEHFIKYIIPTPALIAQNAKTLTSLYLK
jgi:hypothetical protein